MSRTTASRPVVTLTLAFFAAVAGLAHAQAGSLSDDVRRVMNAKKFGEARIGVSIRDVTSGTELASYNSTEPLIPASNMKLLTSGAALLTLTPEFAFKTEVLRDGDRIIIRGGGDPALADPAILQAMNPKVTVEDVLAVMAKAVKQSQAKQPDATASIRELVVDDRIFDRQTVHPDWPIDQLNRGYCAEVSGLNFHANILLVYPKPNPEGAGAAPLYALQPQAPWVRITNRARTVGQGKNSVWLARDEKTDDLIMRGDVRVPTTGGIEVTIRNPAAFTGQLLASAIAQEGVAFQLNASGDRVVRLADANEDFSLAKPIAAVTTPIAEVLGRCNKDSENLYAESLMKRAAYAVTKEQGSWANGAAVLRMVLSQHLGANESARTTIADGSGLSRGNAVAPATLTRWLKVMSDNPTTSDIFVDSLATIGEGTLKTRYQGLKLKNQLRAKSGYISGVRCLSGYLVHAESGRRVAFSVMVNNISGDNGTQSAFDLNEEVIRMCDRWLTAKIESDKPRAGG